MQEGRVGLEAFVERFLPFLFSLQFVFGSLQLLDALRVVYYPLLHRATRIVRFELGARGFVRHMEKFGLGRVFELSRLAVEWGNSVAKGWAHDMGFVGYVSMMDLNQPSGFGV